MTAPCARTVAAPVRPVLVELVALSAADGRLRSRCRTASLLPDVAPDDAAWALARAEAAAVDDVVLHSTSWRCRDGAVVLTYAAFPCAPADEDEEVGEHLVCGTSAQRPAAPDPQDAHVAAHAARHLTYLAAGRDPHVSAAAGRRPQEWRVLRGLGDRAHVHAGTPLPA